MTKTPLEELPGYGSSEDHGTASSASIAVDLTLLGAVSADAFEAFGVDLPVEYANYPQLASCVHAAERGGIDLVWLQGSFHSRSDAPSVLDAARVSARLLSQGAGHLATEIPADIDEAREAVDLLGEQGGSVSIDVTRLECAAIFEDLTRLARDKRMAIVVVVDATTTDELLDRAALAADRVIVRTDDPDAAMQIRMRIRAGAGTKDIPVYGELGIVISGSIPAANERALLIEAMTGRPLFEGKASIVGTVYDVADEIERWVGTGASDGMVLFPASVPTDLASLIRGVIPLLRARGADMVA